MKNTDGTSQHELSILFVEDDKDDCLFFKDALEELPVSAHLTIVHNGERVMEELTKKGKNESKSKGKAS